MVICVIIKKNKISNCKRVKFQFVGENSENIIYDWRYYGGWKNNCVPTA